MENQTTQRKIDEDVEVVKSKLDLEECMQIACDQGKSRFSQLFEIYRLSRMSGRLSADEYYYFQLYDDKQFRFADKTRFASEKFGNHLITRCNHVDWHYKSVDKFRAYSYLQEQGFTTPTTQAVLFEGEREFAGLTKLSSMERLEKFFVTEAEFPIYFKPVYGIGSIGNFLVKAYDDGQVILHDETSLTLEDFYRQVEPKHAYLIQTLLRPHDTLLEISPRLTTVRLIIMFQDGQPKILHTLWKITAADNIADNFWRKGNMLALIDLPTGTVNHVVRGTGPFKEKIEEHPQSKIKLPGFQLPYWSEVVNTCLEGAKTWSQLKFQSWDIGLTPDRPTVVEVNSGSALGLTQLATGQGFLTDEFLYFLKENKTSLKRKPKVPATRPESIPHQLPNLNLTAKAESLNEQASAKLVSTK